MKSQETLSKIMELLNLQDEVKLESMKLENGTTIEAEAFEASLAGLPFARIGEFNTSGRFSVEDCFDLGIGELKEAWQAPLRDFA